MDLKYLIEALRGGNVPQDQRTDAMVRRNPDGSVVRYSSAPVMGKFVPNKMRGWQLYNQEAALTGQTPISYAEWMKTQE